MKRDQWRWAGDFSDGEFALSHASRELRALQGASCLHSQAYMCKDNAVGYKNMNPECSVNALGNQALGGSLPDGGFLLLLGRITGFQ